MPFHGTSIANASLNSERLNHTPIQYFEMIVNHRIRQGWLDSSGNPVRIGKFRSRRIDPDQQKWGLYQLDKDFAQANDPAPKNPDKPSSGKISAKTAAHSWAAFDWPLQVQREGREGLSSGANGLTPSLSHSESVL